MAEHKIVIASDFSPHPGGRYADDGAFSGEEFRERLLWPAVKTARAAGYKVIVVLDGTDGYAASFLEESFGGLVRIHDIDQEELSKTLEIKAEDPLNSVYRKLAQTYIQDALKMSSRSKT